MTKYEMFNFCINYCSEFLNSKDLDNYKSYLKTLTKNELMQEYEQQQDNYNAYLCNYDF